MRTINNPRKPEFADIAADFLIEHNPRVNHLFHYTDVNGLFGIVRSKQLWLTEHSYLKDYSEVVHGLKMLFEDLESREKNAFINYISGTDRQKAILALITNLSYHTFTFSLSEDNDSKSQWNEYGDNYRGMCLGFSYDQLFRTVFAYKHEISLQRSEDKIVYSEPAFLSKVIYSDAEKRSVIKSIVDRALDIVRQNSDKTERDAYIFYRDLIADALYTLMKLFPLFKDDVFAAEKESRIVLLSPIRATQEVLSDLSGIDYRVRNGTIVPYFPLALSELESILYSIRIGAKYNDLKDIFTIKEFCHKNKMPNIIVNKSKVPVQ